MPFGDPSYTWPWCQTAINPPSDFIVHRLRMSTAQWVVQVAVHRLGRTPNEARCLLSLELLLQTRKWGRTPSSAWKLEFCFFVFLIWVYINNIVIIMELSLSAYVWYHGYLLFHHFSTVRSTKAGFVLQLQAIAHSHGPARYHLIRKLRWCQRAADLPVWYLHLQGGASKIAKLVYNSNNYGL